MGNLMHTLLTGKSTLLNTQAAIQTTSHNIANADRPNYARQKTIAQTNPAYRITAGFIGTGANIEQIVQQRDQYIERRLLSSVSSGSHYEELSSQLSTLSAYMLDDGASGVTQALGNFWSSWDSLQKNPTGLSERENVNHAAQRMADVLNTNSNDLQRLLEGVDAEIEMLAGRGGNDKGVVEGFLSDIALLNRQIRLAENPRHHANDLRDKRYEVLDELSQRLPMEYTEEKNGFMTVRLITKDGPVTLVENEESARLRYSAASPGQPQQVQVLPPGLEDEEASWVAVDLDGIVGGQLSGLLAGRDEIEGAQGRLDTFAGNFTDAVNDKLPAGVSSPIFARDPLTEKWSASTAQVWNYYDNDDPDPLKGLSELAFGIAGLSDSRGVGLPNDATFSEYLGELQRHLGTRQWEAQVNGEFNRTLRSELLEQQQFVSGVNLDEEMVDLLRNQQVYQAAAKIIQKTGELLQSVINMV